MEFFRIHRDIPFMRHALVFNVISFVTFLAAVFFLVTRGLHLSIEFTGGTVIEVAYAQPADISKVRATVETMQLGDVQVQTFGSARDVLIRVPLREGVNQRELVGRVFDALCRAEAGAVQAHQSVSDKGEAVSKQVCAASGAASSSCTASSSGEVCDEARLWNTDSMRASGRAQRSKAATVLSKSGASGCAAMASSSPRCWRIASRRAGAKCSGRIDAKGGSV